jgi:hypothetical protein
MIVKVELVATILQDLLPRYAGQKFGERENCTLRWPG